MGITRWNPCSPCCANDKRVYTTTIFEAETGHYIKDFDWGGRARTQDSSYSEILIGGYNSEKITIIEQTPGVYSIELYNPEDASLSGSLKLVFNHVTTDIPVGSTAAFIVNRINEAIGYAGASVVREGILGQSKIRIKLAYGSSIAIPGTNSFYPSGNPPKVHKALVKNLNYRPAIRLYDNSDNSIHDTYHSLTKDIRHLQVVENEVHIIKDQGIYYLDNTGNTVFDNYLAAARKINRASWKVVRVIENAPQNAFYNNTWLANRSFSNVLIGSANNANNLTLTFTLDGVPTEINCGINPTIKTVIDAINAAYPTPLLRARAGNLTGSIFDSGYYRPSDVTVDDNRHRAITPSNHIVIFITLDNSVVGFHIATNNGTVLLGNKSNTHTDFALNLVNVDPGTNFYYDDDYIGSQHITGNNLNPPLAAFLNTIPGANGIFSVSTESIQFDPDAFGPVSFSILRVDRPIINSIDLFYRSTPFSSASGGLYHGYIGRVSELNITTDSGSTDNFRLYRYDTIGGTETISDEYQSNVDPSVVADYFEDMYGPNSVEYITNKLRFRVAANFNNLGIRNLGISDYIVYDIQTDSYQYKRDRSYVYQFVAVMPLFHTTYAIGINVVQSRSDNFTTYYRQLCRLDSNGEVVDDTSIVISQFGTTVGDTSPIIENGYYQNVYCFKANNDRLYIGTGSLGVYTQSGFSNLTNQSSLTICDSNLNIIKKHSPDSNVLDITFDDDGYYYCLTLGSRYSIKKYDIINHAYLWSVDIDARAITHFDSKIFAATTNGVTALDCNTGAVLWNSRNHLHASISSPDPYYLISIMGYNVVATGLRKERFAREKVKRVNVLDEVVLHESATSTT